jgi:uncharacterized membrane protein YkvA (DUF1232 family)
MADDIVKFEKEYTEEKFWAKLARYAVNIGREVVLMALKLYYALQTPDIPVWAKTVIIGALGYFILPLDAIPDLTPVVGYADDLGALAAALATVAMYITPEVNQKALQKLNDWFGGSGKPCD